MKKTKNRIFIIVVIVVLLLLNFFLFYARFWARHGYVETKEEKLEETFRARFIEKDYQEIIHVKEGAVIVYLGKAEDGAGDGIVGNYSIFRKSFIFNRWGEIAYSRLDYNNHPTIVEDLSFGRIYLSLNNQNIVKAEFTEDGQTREISVDPNKPLIVITALDIDSITFFTKSGEELSEQDFLDTVD